MTEKTPASTATSPARPEPLTPLDPQAARLQRWEIVCVFAVSLGASGLYALVNFIGSLTAHQSLGKQTAVLNGSLAPGRPLLDLFLQLTNITLSLAPVLLVFYLLARAGEGPSSIGVDARQPGRDLARGAALAAVIGGSGLGLYLIAYHIGVELNVVAENLPDIWWRIPVLLLSAFQNAILEEVVVLGYLMSRLERLGVRPSRAIAISAVIRGSYHLYQGAGAFIGNAVMGAIFGVLLPPVGPGDPDDHRALPDRRGGLRRLRAPGRSRVLAAQAMTQESQPHERARPALGPGVGQPAPAAGLGDRPDRAAWRWSWCWTPRSWRLAGKVITIAHEGGHALVSVLSGRRLDGIRLHADSSGVTYSRGRRNGPGLVLTAAAGYVMPSLLGAGAAWLLAARHLTAMLWLALVLLVATFLAVRNLFGALAVLVTAGGVFVVSYYATAVVQAGFAYLAAWFLLFGGVRPVLELARGSGRRQRWARGSDADQLARLTGAPAGLWVTLFMLVSLAALVVGAGLLLPPGWHPADPARALHPAARSPGRAAYPLVR